MVIDKLIPLWAKFRNRHLALILKQPSYAVGLALLFSLMPYTLCFSLMMIALVTLRKGIKPGLVVFFPVLLLQVAMSMTSMSWSIAVFNALAELMPCLFAAAVLRQTQSWQMMACGFFVCIWAGALVLQNFYPGFVEAQFFYFKNMMQTLPKDHEWLTYFNAVKSTHADALGHYFFGTQSMIMVLMSVLPVLVARKWQSELFYPGGFKQEMLSFRADRMVLLVFFVVLYAAFKEHAMAIDVFPLLLLYLTATGLSLIFYILCHKNMAFLTSIMIVGLLLKPFVMIPAFVILGLLDGLFNFRLYLPFGAGKTT